MSVDATHEDAQPAGGQGDALIEVRDLVKEFPIKGSYLTRRRALGAVHAVDGVSFDVHRGETFGIVGESGCGKIDDRAPADAAAGADVGHPCASRGARSPA